MADLTMAELGELHRAYDKHEMIGYACIFNKTSYAVVYACPCGGMMGYSAVSSKSSESAPPLKSRARWKNIRQEWIDPLVKLAAMCPVIGTAWMAMDFNLGEHVPGLTAAPSDVELLEKKYGLRK